MKDIITVIGSINIDAIVKTERMPERGETAVGDEMFFQPGGKGANQAIALARLGKSVNLIARRGKDFIDGLAMKNLDHPNINQDYIIYDGGERTGVALVNTIGKKGNKVILYSGANKKLSSSDIEKAKEAIFESKAVLISTEINMDAVKKAAELAKSKEIPVILNIAAVSDDRREAILSILDKVEILITNEREGGHLTNRVISHVETGYVAGKELLKKGVKNVIVTMGKEGALLITEKGSEIFPGYANVSVDTVGAGDAFCAALTMARVEGMNIEDAINMGNAAASIATTKIGPQDPMPDRETLDKFMKERGGPGGVYKDYNDTIKMLEIKAQKLRTNIIKMLGISKSGHPGGSLSAIDIITVLYFHTMKIDSKNPLWDDRDKFVLSKGHASPALYAALAERGYIAEEELWKLRKIDCILCGHPDMKKIAGVDMTTGSLGQGLSAANGMALAAKLQKKGTRVYCMLGDGELEEGQIWEAAMTSYHRRLDNICAIVDYNGLQIDGSIGEVKSGVEPLVEKWKAFNWNVIEIDGHNYEHIIEAFEEAKKVKGIPTMIIARTLKGKGVSFMERHVDYHGAPLTDDETARAIKELGDK